LFWKYIVVMVALVGGALLVSGLIEIYFSYQENKDALVALQREKAVGAASRIEGFIKEIEHQIGWTTQPQLVAPAAALEQRRLDYVRLQKQVPSITELSYLDASGREQLRLSRLAMDVMGGQTDYSKDPRFTVPKSGRVYYGPVYFRKGSEPYMIMALPTIALPGSGGRGVTVADVNLKFIWDVVSQIKIGKAGRAFVVDSQGALIAHPDISLVLQNTNMSQLPQVRAALAGTGASTAPGDEVPIARDLQGRRILTAHSTIAPLRWSVFVEQPLEEAFQTLSASAKRTGLLIFLGVLFAVGASVLLARRMVQPIRALEQGAAKIGAGELGHRIDVKTGDEVEALAERFNQMTAHLQESYATLEQRVVERTRELSEALAQLTALGEVSHALSSTLHLETVLATIATRTNQLAGADGCAIYGYDETAEEFRLLRASDDFAPAFLDAIRQQPIPKAEGILGRAATRGEPVQIADITVGTYLSPVRDLIAAAGYRALLVIPLLREEHILGGLVVNRKAPGEFPVEVVNLLKTLATQSALAIQNARLFGEIEEKTRELEVANRHKSEFLANMSHELRTPLNAVIGFSEVLLDPTMFGAINEKQEEYLNDILSSGRHLLSLINDILDLSKIEAGRMELEVTAFDLPQAIDNALILVRERAAGQGIALGMAIDERLGEFRGDERKIKQVLLNLLSNAIKFTPAGGRVDIRAEPVDGHVEISVSDTGVGIAAADQEIVFEEFRQVGTDYAKKREGTGLGLALARRFVGLHGGRIWVKSALGEGSTFTFSLPVRPWPTS
jgi:signal transduction histidine kinase/HAMP domain-containing protein